MTHYLEARQLVAVVDSLVVGRLVVGRLVMGRLVVGRLVVGRLVVGGSMGVTASIQVSSLKEEFLPSPLALLLESPL